MAKTASSESIKVYERELKSLKVADLRLRLQEGGCPPGTDTAKLTKDKCIKELLAIRQMQSENQKLDNFVVRRSQ